MNGQNALGKSGALLVSSLMFVSFLLAAYTKQHPGLAQTGNVAFLTVMTPFLNAFHGLHIGIGGWIDKYFVLVDRKDENEKLQLRIENLDAENAQLRETSYQFQQLKELLDYQTDHSLEGQVADVIGITSKSQQNSLIINKGKKSGVQSGQAVVSGNGLVGQVISVASNSSKVMLISDTLSSVDSLLQVERVRGIINGQGTELLAWNFVEGSAEVKIGDRVITSGLDGIYPRGLTVGVVTRIEPAGRSDLFHRIKISPSVKLNDLESVLVLDPKV